MRICFELLDLLKAHKKGIQCAAVNSFGYIVKSLGPQDVLSVLLTNLRVQERQSCVCSTVAITIVVETCGPFTCIPAILNEYRTAELNVRTGCLKALTFIFECIGPQLAYYCDSVVTMLEDALTDHDLVHRQTASVIMKHVALGVAGNREVLFVSVERLPTLYVLVVHSISCIAVTDVIYYSIFIRTGRRFPCHSEVTSSGPFMTVMSPFLSLRTTITD
jgi:hypothetical protein